MRQTNNNPAPMNYDAVPGLSWLFAWIDNNPRTSSALLWLMAAALVYVVYSYNFTTAL